jgi:uncharacterized protein (DUF433 family)
MWKADGGRTSAARRSVDADPRVCHDFKGSRKQSTEDSPMSFPVQVEAPPLREEADGALRVGDSRVLLEMVVQAFQDGATPETIVQRYSTLKLPDVYAVIAYYLRHPSDVADYLARREARATEVWERIERRQGDLSDIRARLQARRQS